MKLIPLISKGKLSLEGVSLSSLSASDSVSRPSQLVVVDDEQSLIPFKTNGKTETAVERGNEG